MKVNDYFLLEEEQEENHIFWVVYSLNRRFKVPFGSKARAKAYIDEETEKILNMPLVYLYNQYFQV